MYGKPFVCCHCCFLCWVFVGLFSCFFYFLFSLLTLTIHGTAGKEREPSNVPKKYSHHHYGISCMIISKSFSSNVFNLLI